MSKKSPTEAILKQTYDTTSANLENLYNLGALVDGESEQVEQMLDVTEHVSGSVNFPETFNPQLEALGFSTPLVKISVVRGLEGAAAHMRSIVYTGRSSSDESIQYTIIDHEHGRDAARLANNPYPLDIIEEGSTELDIPAEIDGFRYVSRPDLEGLAHTVDLMETTPSIITSSEAVALCGLSLHLPELLRVRQARDQQQSPES